MRVVCFRKQQHCGEAQALMAKWTSYFCVTIASKLSIEDKKKGNAAGEA